MTKDNKQNINYYKYILIIKYIFSLKIFGINNCFKFFTVKINALVCCGKYILIILQFFHYVFIEMKKNYLSVANLSNGLYLHMS